MLKLISYLTTSITILNSFYLLSSAQQIKSGKFGGGDGVGVKCTDSSKNGQIESHGVNDGFTANFGDSYGGTSNWE